MTLPPRPRGRGGGDHGLLERDLDQWTQEERDFLERLLVGSGIPHAWEGGHLQAPHAREGEVDELIGEVMAGPATDPESTVWASEEDARSEVAVDA
mgnify:CR=1 FL=1